MAELTVKQNLPPSTPSKSYRQSDNIRSHHCMEFSLCDATQEERGEEKRRGLPRNNTRGARRRGKSGAAAPRQPEKLRSVKCSADAGDEEGELQWRKLTSSRQAYILLSQTETQLNPRRDSFNQTLLYLHSLTPELRF